MGCGKKHDGAGGYAEPSHEYGARSTASSAAEGRMKEGVGGKRRRKNGYLRDLMRRKKEQG